MDDIHWWKENLPVLLPALAVILSTLATGLSKYPQAKSGLLKIADLLSLVTHKDSPDSLKLPGMRSKPPVQNGQN